MDTVRPMMLPPAFALTDIPDCTVRTVSVPQCTPILLEALRLKRRQTPAPYIHVATEAHVNQTLRVDSTTRATVH